MKKTLEKISGKIKNFFWRFFNFQANFGLELSPQTSWTLDYMGNKKIKIICSFKWENVKIEHTIILILILISVEFQL